MGGDTAGSDAELKKAFEESPDAARMKALRGDKAGARSDFAKLKLYQKDNIVPEINRTKVLMGTAPATEAESDDE